MYITFPELSILYEEFLIAAMNNEQQLSGVNFIYHCDILRIWQHSTVKS